MPSYKLDTEITHRRACPVWYDEPCSCSAIEKMRARLDPAALISKGPWKGSVVDVELDGTTRLTHPSGAVMRLFHTRGAK